MGKGALDLGLSAQRDHVGAYLEAERRFNRAWSGFAKGWIGFTPDARWADSSTPDFGYGVVGGVRRRW